MELILGGVTGFIFGILLQKAEVLRFEKQVGFLLLRDATVLKFMLSAILVGAVGLYGCRELGLIELKVRAATLVPIALGGLTFGVGWAIAGYCPGTAVGALGEGRLHAFWVILGMLAGAALYAETHHHLKWQFLKLYDYGKTTLPEIAGVNHWIIIGALAAVIAVLFAVIERK
jgi:uncharacterized protein